MNSDKIQAAKAAEFAKRWEGRGYERGESQTFWTELLTEVFGVENPSQFIRYEEQVKNMVDSTNFIDGHIPSTKVLIEQKSLGKDLRKGILQSDGSMLTPFQQAKRYVVNMPVSEHPRWIVTCNFSEFLVYDMNQPNGEPEQIFLKDLGKEYYRLQFLIDTKSEHLRKEMQVSMQAGEIVGHIYDALLKLYGDTDAQTLRQLNILCVRLVFCLYAEDAGIFERDQLHNYLSHVDAEHTRAALLELFTVLNTPISERSRYLREELKAFPYTNGGLFAEQIDIPQFTEELRNIILQHASNDFDWSEISPTIFGAVFESTLNPQTRRTGGMHYTSIENIHKVIDPLFLSDLRSEFNTILEDRIEKQRNKKLDTFQTKLASLTFLDPACGSGNFLTETYLSLRRLENEIIRERYHGQTMMGEFVNPIKVSINQFYGIELNDFAVTVATTALWISEAQMLAETERIIKQDIDFLPLKSYANIREGNALKIEWDIVETSTGVPTISIDKAHLVYEPEMVSEPETHYGEANVVMKHFDSEPVSAKERRRVRFDYIMGNPPFVGARMMDEQQKRDVVSIFGAKFKNVGNIDYVSCWHKKTWDLIKGSTAKAAFVSTNSICQGEQVANLWKPLMRDGLSIDFAHRTFRWDSEAKIKAHVHCIIVGFSEAGYRKKSKVIFDNDKVVKAENINAYLMDAPDVFVQSRPRPLLSVPEISIGNKPIDGGNYLFEKEDMEDFVRREPQAAPCFHPWYGAQEFINQRPRYCLWLGDCTPAQLRQMPLCLKRMENVRNLRLESKSAGTRKLADTPARFHVENMPGTDCIIIPRVSSERRRYIPMGFIGKDVLASDAVHLIPNATLYHFGILESNVHMAWVRAVCGRLEMRYRYSKDVVYNNFPWPQPTEEQRKAIEQTAKAILEARALYPESSLADLYDDLTMPAQLRRAHQQNDRAVMQAYGFPVRSDFTESRCVAELFRMYARLTRE